MHDAILVAAWPWCVAGPVIGLVTVRLAAFTGKPLGVCQAVAGCGQGRRRAA